MSIGLHTPSVAELPALDASLRRWSAPGAPLQLHAGDLGWHGRLGAARTAAAVRIWTAGAPDGRSDARLPRGVGPADAAPGLARPRAIALLDGPGLVRLAVDPAAAEDPLLAEAIADHLADPAHGVLPAGPATLEARAAPALTRLLRLRGWEEDEPWAILRQELERSPRTRTGPEAGITCTVILPGSRHRPGARRDADVDALLAVLDSAFAISDRSAVQRRERWTAMCAAPAAERSRFLLLRDAEGRPVAAAGIWAAGPGLPGIIEPLGVHAEHRGLGHGRTITRACADQLREMGAAEMLVGTPADNDPAPAAYARAGMRREADARDLRRV
ncbi:GNAT family N-acetyltransferase [Brachybacterium hainanense]|uniref:GNAT family N-acetyltransferase n=1 Tax=Brachybacterium hainanense TaxID=1541174 RepID=A0ABV6R740_9MICO